jgi:lipopolysaccharide/colanic/teichoic acid biosynthesis glycosyltransferase
VNARSREGDHVGEVLKRLFDIGVAAIALVLLSPVILVVSVVVICTQGWPIFFVQQRPGLHGRPFRILKFRTMRNAVNAAGALQPDAERLTGVGKFLRSSSLDELPALVNVLVGDMSLVGPRPLLMRYLPLYSARQARRHDVRPGITGWAQVNGRNLLTWEEKFEMDVWYVENRGFLLDLKILLRTIVNVLHRKGISASGEATMPEFRGSGPRSASAPD